MLQGNSESTTLAFEGLYGAAHLLLHLLLLLHYYYVLLPPSHNIITLGNQACKESSQEGDEERRIGYQSPPSHESRNWSVVSIIFISYSIESPRLACSIFRSIDRLDRDTLGS